MVTTKQVHQIILHVARSRAKDSLSLSHFAVLAFLYGSARYCTILEMCSACSLSYHQTVLSNKGSVLDMLLKRGLIKIVDTEGVRSHYYITQLGRETLDFEALAVRDYLNTSVFV